MNSYEYIQEVKKTAGLETDYAVAKHFGWAPTKIYQYRDGQGLGNLESVQIAEELGIDILAVIADMELQRAKTEEAKSVWARISKMRKEAGAALPNLLFLNGFIAFCVSQYYILCKISYSQENDAGNVIVHIGM